MHTKWDARATAYRGKGPGFHIKDGVEERPQLSGQDKFEGTTGSKPNSSKCTCEKEANTGTDPMHKRLRSLRKKKHEVSIGKHRFVT